MGDRNAGLLKGHTLLDQAEGRDIRVSVLSSRPIKTRDWRATVRAPYVYLLFGSGRETERPEGKDMNLTVFIGEGLTPEFRPPQDGEHEHVHLFPENNRHPWDQMRFIEDVCINADGHKSVAIVTHSPYIVDHLNNLMYAARLSSAKRKEVAAHFLRKTEAAFIKPDRVSAWSFDSDWRDIMVRKTGRIDWKSFSLASNYVGDVWDRVDDIKYRKKGR